MCVLCYKKKEKKCTSKLNLVLINWYFLFEDFKVNEIHSVIICIDNDKFVSIIF